MPSVIFRRDDGGQRHAVEGVVLAHGIYDAIALSSTVNPYYGGVATLILIYFCVKMHKAARNKIIAQVNRDKGLIV